ncbi:MAG: type II secretion system minor pseudopilin GspH [Endozoicomonas sp.]|uniref:type II secretion system minor pseudopilin GspH n=1 Tax=Endozoicomonas sp. TaxID=1892382 RepID=UPI003D9B2323
MSDDRKLKGFTLVELLVVILIIGVLLGAVTLSSGVISGSPVSDQSARLQALFAQIRDRALIENREYGFSLGREGQYQWWVLEGSRQWRVLDESPFQPYLLTDSMAMELQPGKKGWLLPDQNEDEVYPEIVVFSDRQITPFRLQLKHRQGKVVTLGTDGFSDVTEQM